MKNNSGGVVGVPGLGPKGPPSIHEKVQTMTKFRNVLLGLVIIFAIALGTIRPSSAFLDKTRFAAHLGIAYFCFHHWVLNPYREGRFASGAPHRVSSIVKGGAALLFAVHEVKVSEKIARKSNDPLLNKMAGGLGALAGSFAAVGSKLKGGRFSPQDVDGLRGEATSVNSNASADGVHIKDVPIAIPGI
ncbi:MAG: hypothetical protein M3160_07495 [Candidatus Eremiobacteraeota bacterium]|nr:hypothetical protein [Candidatus Eremiobacteraeota bacterium]